MRFYILYLLAFSVIYGLSCVDSKAQRTIRGVVLDSINGKPLSFVPVYLKGTTIGVLTNDAGGFTLKNPSSAQILIVSSVGYNRKVILLENRAKRFYKILLSPSSYAMSEVVVKPRKEKYRKKGNPAVELIRQVIENKEKHDPLQKPFYQYDHYQKIVVALNDVDSTERKKNVLFQQFKFLDAYVDTSGITGKPILPVILRQRLDRVYYQKSPYRKERVVLADHNIGLDRGILSLQGVNTFLEEIFKPVDLYVNDIPLFLKRFVSPLSTGAIGFYKYYLMDTVSVDGDRCSDVVFVPFSSESTGFVGHLYITTDSTHFVKKVKLSIPKNINLNYVRSLWIDQRYRRTPDGTRLLTYDDMTVEFSVLSRGGNFYARRTNVYLHPSFAPPPAFASTTVRQGDVLKPDTTLQLAEYMSANKLNTIGPNALQVHNMVRRLHEARLYHYAEKTASIIINDFIETSPHQSKVDIGPVFNFVSKNSAEGVRLRVGGLTTAALNDHWFGKGYLAYGTKDHRWKYLAQAEYSFNKKQHQANEFPVHSLRMFYQYDVNWLGQNMLYADNFFFSWKRRQSNNLTYQRKWGLSYNQEFYSHFSYGLDFLLRREYASTLMPFIDNTTNTPVNAYSLGEATVRLRYAPGEKFYQTMVYRRAISHDAPVFTFSHAMALKGVFGSNYNYSYTELGFRKKFWFSAYGDANVVLQAGKIWTKDPFPLLQIPVANLAYTIHPGAFTLMNPMEFINDHYVAWYLNYNMNGLILNRIPLIRYLKWREIISFRGIYGGLDKKNNPALSNGLFDFPAGSYAMGKAPYMEAGVGIDNIFNLFRVDYVWRLNYLNHPHIDKSGIRVTVDLGF
ncbi:DUF5686 and carboxypeptidase-like regulatory domain-containing protein [Microbacter margulisiae]|uniref:Carboxypeptidase-like regulatory domain-containing protein n=1 Tax=Microbacter margulisiae TaxID=1350067 RepID=A0A7W5DR20_9PORP|nr:DUF5686 and carboxypeptidase-like regulatory domain-containing protein [Microbacter margulisiae]MBB3187512.1 hypothetical protein [Microbacter margulisiae]